MIVYFIVLVKGDFHRESQKEVLMPLQYQGLLAILACIIIFLFVNSEIKIAVAMRILGAILIATGLVLLVVGLEAIPHGGPHGHFLD